MSAIDSFTTARSAAAFTRPTTDADRLPPSLIAILALGMLATLCEIMSGIDLSAAYAVML
jgi:hypothetical protein